MSNKELNTYMHDFIKEICKDIGPRESGTEAEILTGNRIEDEMKKFCDTTQQEEYISSPTAFLGGVRYGALLILISIILYWLSLLIDLDILPLSNIYSTIFLLIDVILITLTVSYFILEVMRYHEAFDFLFPKKASKNVIGVIEPTKEQKNSIIFSAHHDSAYEFNIFYYLKRFGQLTIFVGYLGVVILFIIVILKLILNIFSIYARTLFFIFGIVFLCLIPIVIAYIFFHSYNSVLGAFDNLSGVAIVLGIGRILSENKTQNKFIPKHTKVYLISFAGEEAGLRGAKRYLKKHYEELKKENTKLVNMDGISQPDNIAFLKSEPLIGAKHSEEIYTELAHVAEDLDLEAGITILPFGATDAAAFSKKNLPATSICGLNLVDELVGYYHTRNDTPDVVNPEALGVVVDICIEYLKRIDSTK
ncbi:MAG: conserved membrane protein of unknown function [Promethearchaeota archaeon]|nr:MAG: conserved membrane protein of unknown function [Candidatus Lokiarchaeota archaeon]